MIQKLIFECKDIEIHEQKFDGIQGTSYTVTRGDVSYSTWDKPPFDYNLLRESIADYLEERDRSIMEDVENENLFEEEDFDGYFRED